MYIVDTFEFNKDHYVTNSWNTVNMYIFSTFKKK